MRFALLSYNTTNIGDEIQSLAALRFLPRVDYLYDRDRPSTWAAVEPTKIIMNGWFKLNPHDWPIRNAMIKPLFVSFHISDTNGSESELLLTPEALAYYKQYEPIGCRDYATVQLLNEHGVQAYFSGCLTLTLRRRTMRRTDAVVVVDVPSEVIRLAPSHVQRRIAVVSHIRRGNNRFQSARGLLDLYSSVSFVVTSRLHCALSCVAFDTPVLFLREDFSDRRFGGLKELLPCAKSSDVLSGKTEIPWDWPPSAHGANGLKDELARRCELFSSENGISLYGFADKEEVSVSE